MNKIEQLEAVWPNYVFTADASMPMGLPALNINEIIYFNPNVPFQIIWTRLAEELGHCETTPAHDISGQLTPLEWKEERTARDFGLELAVPSSMFLKTLTSHYDNDWQAAEHLDIDVETLYNRKALYDRKGK